MPRSPSTGCSHFLRRSQTVSQPAFFPVEPLFRRGLQTRAGEPSVSLVEHMEDGRFEGIVLKDRTSSYRDGTRVGWSKVKDRSWYEREEWRFDRR
jgi:hypothetical protein